MRPVDLSAESTSRWIMSKRPRVNSISSSSEPGFQYEERTIGERTIDQGVKVVHVNKRAKRADCSDDNNDNDKDCDNDNDNDHEKDVIVVKFHQFSNIDFKAKQRTYISSPAFECGGVRWNLKLTSSTDSTLSGEGPNSSQTYHLGVYLFLDDAPWLLGEEYAVISTISIPKLAISDRGEGPDLYRVDTNGAWGSDDCTTVNKVLDDGLDDDTLSVHVKFHQLQHIHNRWTPSLAFNRDRLKMLRTETHADITFVVGTGDEQQRIKANTMFILVGNPAMRLIMAGATPVETTSAPATAVGGSIGDEKCISLPETNPRHFRSMLRFIYADDVSFITDDTTQAELRDLLLVAHLFGCWKLKIVVETRLAAKYLDVASCVDLLVFADAHRCCVLEEECVKVVLKNLTEVFQRGHHIQLARSGELMKKIAESPGHKRSSGDDRFDGMRIDELYRWLDEREDVVLEGDMGRGCLLERVRSLESKGQSANGRAD